MGIRTVNNTLQSFLDNFLRSGTDASGEFLESFSATGGTISTPGNGYKYHTFTSSGTFTVSGAPRIVEVLVVGGGGGTGAGYFGGGGGGGVSIHRAYSIGSGSYSVSVGAESGTGAGATGNPSSFSNITSLGGGFGAPGYTSGGPGGSGGGGQESTYPAGSGLQPSQNAPLTPNPNFSQYGNPGGAGQTTGLYAAAGGGGAGGAGGISPGPGPGGIGGPGIAVPGFEYNLVGISPVIPIANSPTNNHYGAGGGGWGYSSQPYPTGGGGIGGYGPSPTQSQFGVNYLGGGAGNAYNSPAPAKTGGSGIVVIRYLSS